MANESTQIQSRSLTAGSPATRTQNVTIADDDIEWEGSEIPSFIYINTAGTLVFEALHNPRGTTTSLNLTAGVYVPVIIKKIVGASSTVTAITTFHHTPE